MPDINKKYCYNKDFELSVRSDKYIYINYDTADWLRTNKCGFDIISKCNGVKRLGNIMEDVSTNSGIPAHVIFEGCREFLEKAEDSGLIYIGDSLTEIKDSKMHMLFPETVWLHVSAKCNLHCPFCYSESSIERNDMLDSAKVIDFLSQIDTDYRNYVVISGGEPFLYNELETLLENIKKLGFKTVQLITNGTVGHERYETVMCYVDRIQFSVDGTTADVNDISRGKGSFEKLCKGIRRANEVGFKQKILSFTASSKNIHQMPDVPSFALKNYFDQINIGRIINVGRGKNITGGLCDDEFNRYAKAFADEFAKASLIRHLELSFADDVSQKLIIPGRRYSCGLADSLISVCYDGTVYPCPSLHDKRFAIGNYTDRLSDVLKRGHELNELYSVRSDSQKCGSCKYRYFCGGGCLAKRLACPDDSYCISCISRIDELFTFVGQEQL